MKYLLCFLLIYSGFSVADSSHYVGAESCAECHQTEYQKWQQSDHANSMALASASTVLGDFSGQQLNFHGMPFKAYRKGQEFWVESVDKHGELKQYQVSYVFAYDPIQTYIIDIGDGHLQVHNVAWNNAPKNEGGQHWFHLQPNEAMSPDHPFFWQGAYQNSNARCAECHTTNYQKNYDEENHAYNTSWSDINVACESCHGPASHHVELANKQLLTAENSGFTLKMDSGIEWTWQAGAVHAQPKGKPTQDYVNMCGACHSRRTSLGPLQSDPAMDYHEQFRLQNVVEPLYFADGQIQDEVFVLGSFTQSKMYQSGVTCNNCHDVHSGKVRTTDNALCAQCHMPTEFDTTEHHGHEYGTEGAQCINCHMPARNYMVHDPRRDHSFNIPRPELAAATGSPDVCSDCHQDKSTEWAQQAVESWPKGKSSANVSQVTSAKYQGHRLTRNSEDMLAKALDSAELPTIIQASLIETLGSYGSQAALEQATEHLVHQSPQVRRSAVDVFRSQTPKIIWQHILPMLNDKSLLVRASAIEALLYTYQDASPLTQQTIDKALAEYRHSLRNLMDMPSSQMSFAQMALMVGDTEGAQQRYQKALLIDPSYLPALINLADLSRHDGDTKSEQAYWQKALHIAPDSAAVQHGYGLMLIRHQQHREALEHLRLAASSAQATPRYALIYAVALAHQGDRKKAIKVLNQANNKWPARYDVLVTLVTYLEQQGQSQQIMAPLLKLIKMAPDSPQVQYWQRVYIKN